MTEPFWEHLFSGPGANADRTMRLVRKNGVPLLLLPMKAAPAARALELYPAQSAKARFARAVMRLMLRFSIAAGTEQVRVPVSGESRFVQFIAEHSATKTPAFGVLAGNPSDDSQRFIVLAFGESDEPRMVVKAGTSGRARTLVRREAEFLESVPKGKAGVPAPLGRFESDFLTALALPYVEGRRPGRRDLPAVQSVLDSWVEPSAKAKLAETEVWKQLVEFSGSHPIWQQIVPKLERARLARTLMHGDFAPWNVKIVSAAACVALDWERGNSSGLPGWDFFHYMIQPAILVHRSPMAALMGRIEELLHGTWFHGYAERAGITDCVQEMLLAYLLHITEIIKPAQGGTENRELLSALAQQWSGRGLNP